MLWLGIVIFPALLVGLHSYSRGRTNPIAALGFVLGGPFLGVFLLVVAALREMGRSYPGVNVPSDGMVFGMSVAAYLLTMTVTGLAAASIFAAAYAAWIRDELRILKTDRECFVPSQPPIRPALRALGLSTCATLDEIERAYRRLALKMHPDHGGDPEQFKQLHEHFQRAKAHLAKPSVQPPTARNNAMK